MDTIYSMFVGSKLGNYYCNIGYLLWLLAGCYLLAVFDAYLVASVPKNHIHRQMIRKSPNVTRTKERSVTLISSIFLIIYKQEIRIENMRTTNLLRTDSIG